jgi:threonyl-tRNA synthetase
LPISLQLRQDDFGPPKLRRRRRSALLTLPRDIGREIGGLAARQIQVRITSDADDYAREVIAAARQLGLRVEGDLRNEKINYKVREHSLAKVPALLVVGKKESAERLVSIRRLGSEGQQVLPLDEALAALASEAVPPDMQRAQKPA